MTKHRKCSNCKGVGEVIDTEVERNGRLKSVVKTCPVCKGTGYEEKKSSSNEVWLK